jgi:hypothetical protein
MPRQKSRQLPNAHQLIEEAQATGERLEDTRDLKEAKALLNELAA